MIRERNSESGQALLLVIVGMSLFIFGALGLGIDGALLYVHRQMAQSAADAAAQAGIMSIYDGTNATGSNTFATGSPAASFTCTTSDARTPCVYARYNGFGGTSGDTVTVNFPSTITGVTLSSASVPAISVTVQRTVHGGFIQMLGLSSTTIKAKASAGIVGSVPSSCVYTLNASASGAFSVSNGASVVSDCAVEVKSSSSSGGTVSGGSSLTASAVHGKFSLTNGGTANPTPSGAASSVADPFISLPAPAVASSCDSQHTNYSAGNGTWTLNPGTYCGGISLSNSAIVTFNPGTYVIKGGSLNIGFSTITGSGVTFYLTGTNSTYGSVSIGNGASVTLTPPASGTYQGILFYQDRSITSAVNATFAGGVSLHLTGSLYFPTTGVSIQNGASSDGYNLAIISDKVSFTGGAHFTYDPTGTKTGLAIRAVALIE